MKCTKCGCEKILKVETKIEEKVGYINEDKEIVKKTREDMEIKEIFYCAQCGKML